MSLFSELKKIAWLESPLVRENLLYVKYNQTLIRCLKKFLSSVSENICIYLVFVQKFWEDEVLKEFVG